MEYAFGINSCCSYDAASALPSHLDHLSVRHQNRNGVRRDGHRLHAGAGLLVGFHIKSRKILARPLEPFAHLAGVWTTRCAVEFQVRHSRIPPSRREECDKSTPELPEYEECNRSAQSEQNPRGHDERFLRRRSLTAQR